jgi:hypothetical protein
MKPGETPVTECWRESYEKLACEARLEYFPTRAYLKANPEKSGQFCHWLWRLLSEKEGKVCEAEKQACLDCQKQGLSKWTAMYVLAHIIRDEDPGLFILLQRKCRQYQKGPSLRRPDDFSPDDPLGPKGPLAARMSVPLPPIFTDAVARELKDRPWMYSYL